MLSVLLFAVGGLVTSLKTENSRLKEEIAALQELRSQAAADAEERYLNMESTKNAAIQKAHERAAQLAADRSALSVSVERMRKQLATAHDRAAEAPRAAIVEYVQVGGEVLHECIAEYRRMAEAADGHADDALMLKEAWPR